MEKCQNCNNIINPKHGVEKCSKCGEIFCFWCFEMENEKPVCLNCVDENYWIDPDKTEDLKANQWGLLLQGVNDDCNK